MASYGQLKTDIAAWLVGDDISATIPSIVLLAEQRHRFGLVQETAADGRYYGAIRVRDMERRARLEGNGTEYLPMPMNILEHRSLAFVYDGIAGPALDYIEPAGFPLSARRDNTAIPTAYTITRNEFRFNIALTDDHIAECVYFTPYAPLVDDADTNWLLDNAYSLYLFGALCEAAPYIEDDHRIALWEGKYAQAAKAVNRTEQRARQARSGVTMRSVRPMP